MASVAKLDVLLYKNKGMKMQTDPGWMTAAISALGASFTGLSTWAWLHTHKRIDTVETKANSYVTNEAFMEHTRTRDERLDRIDAAMEKTEMRFLIADKENRIRHEALLDGQTKMLVALEGLKK
jgi:hypothetical protein